MKISEIVPMEAIVIRTRIDEGTESAEVATSARTCNLQVHDGGDKNVFETLLDIYVYVV